MRKQSIGAVALAIMLIVGSGAVMAAAPTVDSETTNTASTSEITDGSTITYNASTNSTLQFSTDSNNASVQILQNGTHLSTYDNSSDAITVTDATNNHYNFTIADDETGHTGIEAGAGENVSLTYRLINDSAVDDPDTTNVTVYWENDANKTFLRMGTDDTEVQDQTGRFAVLNSIPYLGLNDSEPGAAQIEREDISVNGDSQDSVTMYVENGSAQESVTEVYSAATDSSSISFISVAMFDGQLVPVTSEGQSLPDWMDENATYMTVSDNGDTISVQNPGNELGTDTASADVSFVANDGMWITDLASMMQDAGASTFDAYSTAATNFDWNGSPTFGEE